MIVNIIKENGGRYGNNKNIYKHQIHQTDDKNFKLK